MKRAILTLTFGLACVTGFAQGRIQFSTDSLHLVYYDPFFVYAPPSFAALAGQAVWGSNMPPGFTLMADFYIGTSSSTLSLATTTTFSNLSPGKWNPVNYQSPTIPGGTTVFVVAQIREDTFAPPSIWNPFSFPVGVGPIWGYSQEFTFVLGTSTAQYPPMYTHNASLGGGFSTWPMALMI